MDTARKQQYNLYIKDAKVSKDMLDTAMQQGEEKGIEKGIEKGKIEGKIEVIINGYDNGLAISLLANITNFVRG
jgi:predicted transposase/invertase (TIGR01784 family)